MDHLGVNRASLIGNSMGGRIAWNFAAAHPDRVNRLVLVSPDGFASPGFAYDHGPRRRSHVGAALFRAAAQPPEGGARRRLWASGALSEATLTRYRDLLLAPGVRRAIVARMGQMIRTTRPRRWRVSRSRRYCSGARRTA